MKARIYQPAKNAMQSGRAKTSFWMLELECETARAPEPVMGWTAVGDTAAQTRMKFATREDAVAFAEKKGWEYSVSTPQSRIVTPRNYVENFKYRPAGAADGK